MSPGRTSRTHSGHDAIFVDHQHPRGTDGPFTAEDHPEAEPELRAPALTMAEAIGDRGPRFHDMDSRPAYKYTRIGRAVAAFRTQFGAAPDARRTGSTASRVRTAKC